MNEKIVVSFYKQDEDAYDSKPELIYTRGMVTGLCIEDVALLVKPGEGYYLSKTKGNNISFLDCIYYHGQENDFIRRIEEMPEEESYVSNDSKLFSNAIMVSTDSTEEDWAEIRSKETPFVSNIDEYWRGAGAGDYDLFAIAFSTVLFLLSPFYGNSIERMLSCRMKKTKKWVKGKRL